MKCSNCSQLSGKDAKYCRSCGFELTEDVGEDVKQSKGRRIGINKKTVNSPKRRMDKWMLGDEDKFSEQVTNYHNLSITKSYRGQAALWLALTSATTVFAVIVEYTSVDAIFDVGLILFLSFFVYKGKKWAIIIAGIVWIFEKGYFIFAEPDTIFWQLVWLVLIVQALYKAFIVEKLRS